MPRMLVDRSKTISPARGRSHSPQRTTTKSRRPDKSPERSAVGGGEADRGRTRDKSPSSESRWRRMFIGRRGGGAGGRGGGGAGGDSQAESSSHNKNLQIKDSGCGFDGADGVDDDKSVGSALSIADQFDIIIPTKPAVLYNGKNSSSNSSSDTKFDDVSSITTDEYRKYGGLLWRFAQNMGNSSSPRRGAKGGDAAYEESACCPTVHLGGDDRNINTDHSGIHQAETSASRTVQSNAQTRTTAGRMGVPASRYLHNGGDRGEGGRDAYGGGISIVEGNDDDANIFNFYCCGGAGGDYMSRKNNKAFASYKRNRRGSPSRYRSVDRMASLFDGTLSETDPANTSTNYESVEQEYSHNKNDKSNNGPKWRLARALPWNRRKTNKTQNNNNNTTTEAQDQMQQQEKEERQQSPSRRGRELTRSRSTDRGIRRSQSRDRGSPRPRQ